MDVNDHRHSDLFHGNTGQFVSTVNLYKFSQILVVTGQSPQSVHKVITDDAHSILYGCACHGCHGNDCLTLDSVNMSQRYNLDDDGGWPILPFSGLNKLQCLYTILPKVFAHPFK